MVTETGGATRPSCPFADVRPEGCICIALADNKRISVDYQSRFCFTENHVRCRRFQRAVPEIPDEHESRVAALIDDPRAVAAVAIVSILLFLAIIATAFHGTWTGWFSGNGESTATVQTANGTSVSPTSIIIGGGAGTATGNATPGDVTPVPVLIVTPTAQAGTTSTVTTPVVTETTTPTAGTATVTATTSPATSTVVPTAVPTPQIVGPVYPNPPVANSGTSSVTTGSTGGATTGGQGGQGGASGYVVPSTSFPVNVITASAPAVHTVQPGDTINSIGAAYGVPTVLIAVANNLADSDLIMPGDHLFIPTADGHLPPDAPLAGVHLVVKGDTMSTIAEAFDVSVETLMSYNGITNPDLIQVGDIILVPKAATLASVGPQTTDVVQRGDTLFSISQRFGVTVEDIMQANGLSDRDTVRIGQLLIIPSA